jgi:uncharacterized protein (TIGR03435 family)
LLIAASCAVADDVKPGDAAPALTFTKLLQAPAGTKVDWPSLHGKVVVLEFWATWCAPCVAEIPILNALVSSLDGAKVQFVSVDDEDPEIVEAFLKKKPISGWLGIDNSGTLFDHYGVSARPTTVVIDPDGRVVSTTVRPEQLKRDQLLALAEGKKVVLGGDVDPKVEAQLKTAISEAMTAETRGTGDLSNALFEISLTQGDPVTEGKELNSHAMMLGPGRMDITDATIASLLSFGAGVPSTRIHKSGDLPTARYNLHVNAPNAAEKQLTQAIELAIASGAHVHIEHHTDTEDAYVLTAAVEANSHFTESSAGGGAFYNSKTQTLHCLNAAPDDVASALEEALHIPVVNETGLSGKVMMNLKIAPKDPASANAAIKALGLKLDAAKRPIETVILSPGPENTSH